MESFFMNGGEKTLNNFTRKLYLENTLRTNYSRFIIKTPDVSLRFSSKFCEATLKNSRFKTRFAVWNVNNQKIAKYFKAKFYATPNFHLTLYNNLSAVISAKQCFGEQSHPIYVTIKARFYKDASFSSKLKLGPRFDGAIVRSYTYIDNNATCYCFDADFPHYMKFFTSARLDKVQILQPPLTIAYEIKNYYRFISNINNNYTIKIAESLKIPIGMFKMKIGQFSENKFDQEFRIYRNIILGLCYSNQIVSVIYDRLDKKLKGINSTMKLKYNQQISISSRIIWEFRTNTQSISLNINYKDV